MKIAILTSGILPLPALEGGAVETLIDYYLAYNEKERLHEITVFSVIDGKKWKNYHAENTNTYYYHIKTNNRKYKFLRKLYGIFYLKKAYYHYHIEYYLHLVLKQLKRTSYDVIVLENRPGYAEKVAKACPNSRIILHLHNDLLNEKTAKATVLKSSLFSSINVSNYIKERIDTILPNVPSFVCYNGIDLSRFEINTPKSFIRKKFGFKDSDFVLVFSGRLIAEKGVKELLQAFGSLTEPKIKLMIIGGNFFGNDNQKTPYMEELQNLANHCKDRIVFTGFRAYNEMPSLLESADLAIIPSIWEDPCPLSCIEAMAAGLPLIVTRSGGIPELVNNKCSIILEKDSFLVENMVTVISDLYHDPKQRIRMGQAAKKRSLLFDKDTFARRFFTLLQDSSI